MSACSLRELHEYLAHASSAAYGNHFCMLQSTTYYHKAVDNGSKLLDKAYDTTVYKNAKTKLYPSIAPYADPAYNSITSNTYYKAAVDHLKPVSPYTAKSL